MTKSILTLLGIIVTFGAIVAGLAGAFELTEPLLVAILFVFVILFIFFARFGGFKPFFAAGATTTSSSLPDTDAAEALSRSEAERRLISVGAEVEETRSLFGEREPISTADLPSRTPIFDDDTGLATVADSEARSPLFGDALSEQLEAEKQTDTGITWSDSSDDADSAEESESSGDVGSDEADDGDVASPGDEAVSDAETDTNDDEPVASDLEIEVDADPDWIADSPATDDEDPTVEPAAEVAELDEVGTDLTPEVTDETLSGEPAGANPEAEVDGEVEPSDAEPAVAGGVGNEGPLEDGTVLVDDIDAAPSLDKEDGTGIAEDAQEEPSADPAEVLEAEVVEAEVVEAESFTAEPVVGPADVEFHASDSVDLDDLEAENLVAALDSLAPGDPSDATAVEYMAEPVVMESTGLAVANGTDLPVVVESPAAVELHKYSSAEIMSVVKTQEGHLVDTLIDEGVLSTQGPLTDKDVRTMVFVAVSSTELIDVLTEGQRDAVALNGGATNALDSGS